MVVGFHQEKPELRQNYNYKMDSLFRGRMRKMMMNNEWKSRYIYGNTLARARITQHGIVTWLTDLISNGLMRHGIR